MERLSSPSISPGELPTDGREESTRVSRFASCFVVEAEAGARVAAWLFNESAVRESMAGIWPEFEKLLVDDGRSPTAGGGVEEWSRSNGSQSAAC